MTFNLDQQLNRKYRYEMTQEISLNKVDSYLIMISDRSILAIIGYELDKEAQDEVNEKDVFKEEG